MSKLGLDRAFDVTHQNEDASQVDDDAEAGQDQDAVAGKLADGAHLGVFHLAQFKVLK